MTAPKVLDLVSLEEDRQQVRIDDKGIVYMVAPDDIGPRDFARISAMSKYADLTGEDVAEEDMEAIEDAMTEAAAVVLPDMDRERLHAVPFMRRAKVIQAFVSGLRSQSPGLQPNRETRRAAGRGKSGSRSTGGS